MMCIPCDVGLTFERHTWSNVVNMYHAIHIKPFLADRTIGRAFGTLCRLSVCLSYVTFCIVAKRHVLAKNCLKE